MPTATSAPEFGSNDRDGHQVAAVPLLAFGFVSGAAGFDDSQLVQSEGRGDHVDERLAFLDDLQAGAASLGRSVKAWIWPTMCG